MWWMIIKGLKSEWVGGQVECWREMIMRIDLDVYEENKDRDGARGKRQQAKLS